jgi:hypothetical protein
MLALVVGAPSAQAKTRHLTYSAVSAAAVHRAQRIAGHPVKVQSVRVYQFLRDPTGCKGCGYDETTGAFVDTPTTITHTIDFVVKFARKSGKALYVTIESRSDY